MEVRELLIQPLHSKGDISKSVGLFLGCQIMRLFTIYFLVEQ